ncbi:MAG: SRPBCC family protein [Aminipila sp.]
MRKSSITAILDADIQKVWDIVTNNENHQWRSDLSEIKIIDDNHFVEYTKDGIATEFTIKVKQECEKYEFDMENKNMTGHWLGLFSETEEGCTKIEFSEELYIKNPIIEWVSYFVFSIKKIQERYIEDLRNELKK